jgi:hypothetical protein
MRSILVSYQYEIYRTTVRENCSVLSVKYYIVFVMPINGAIANKDKNTTVRFSVRNCTYGCQMYY